MTLFRLITLALAGSLTGLAAHIHCDKIPFSVNSSGTIPSTLPADYRPGGNAGGLTFFTLIFDVPAPPASSVPGCVYEISDITSVSVTLSLTGGPIDWTRHMISVAGSGESFGGVLESWPGPANFGGIGTGTVIETLAPHEPGPGDAEFRAPARILFDFRDLSPEPASYVITGASGTISGTHYYLPEPGGFWLAAAGMVLTALRLRRRLAGRR